MSACRVPSQSDVAGVGVRAAVYIQALFATFISVLQEGDSQILTEKSLTNSPVATLHDDDPELGTPGTVPIPNANEDEKRRSTSLRISVAENNQPGTTGPLSPVANSARSSRTGRQRSSTSVSQVVSCLLDPELARNADRDLEWSLFVTGSAFITSAMIQAFSKHSGGLTDYHALVVLNLSFINHWAGVDLLRRRTSGKGSESKDYWKWKVFSLPFKTWRGALLTFDSWLPFYLHATLLSVFGIIFWSRQHLFQNYFAAHDCTTTPTVYWAFRPIPLHNRALIVSSYIFYFFSVIPGLNGLFIQLLSWISAALLAIAGVIVTLVLLIVAFIFLVIGRRTPYLLTMLNLAANRRSSAVLLSQYYDLLNWLRPFYRRVTTVVYMGPVFYWIVATEMLVHSNAPFAKDDNPTQTPWTYGQVMSLMTASVVVLLYCRQVRDKILEVRESEKKWGRPDAGRPRIEQDNRRSQEINGILQTPVREELARPPSMQEGRPRAVTGVVRTERRVSFHDNFQRPLSMP